MDDVLIIVLTLAFTILAAVNNSKKKKQPATGEARQPDFWKVLFPEAETREVNVPEDVRQVAPPVRPAPQSFKQARRREPSGNFSEEGIRNETVIKKAEAKIQGTQEAEVVEESILEDFTLRKAVIYSEILQPKYF